MYTKKLMILALLCYASTAFAQEISRSTQASAGASVKNTQGYSLTSTVGAQFSQIVKDGNHLTEGFQQGNLNSTFKRSEEEIKEVTNEFSINKSTAELLVEVLVYPNPTVEQLYISIKQSKITEANVLIFDQSGKKIFSQKINASEQTPISIQQVNQLTAGSYFIQVTSSEYTSKSVNFIKAQ